MGVSKLDNQPLHAPTPPLRFSQDTTSILFHVERIWQSLVKVYLAPAKILP